MLQSTAKGASAAKNGEARPATQAFVTEPPKVQTIAVGDAAHKNARRAHDATLVGLAPPPALHMSSVNTQPLALPQAQTLNAPRDDRRLATILVVGTLLAMFSIAYSALPDRDAAREPAAAVAEKRALAGPTADSKVIAEPPRKGEAAVPTPAAPEDKEQPRLAPEQKTEPRVAPVKTNKSAPVRTQTLRPKTNGKADAKPLLKRRAKPIAE